MYTEAAPLARHVARKIVHALHDMPCRISQSNVPTTVSYILLHLAELHWRAAFNAVSIVDH